MSIGEVVTHLREEFPDLRESKVRFLESEGLLTPERTSAGYRRYTDADVDLLRRILRLQRDHFWPLKVIADHILSGAPDDDSAAVAQGPVRPVRRGQRVGRETLLGRARLSATTLDQLQSFGLVRPDGAGLFGEDQVEIASVASALIAYGVEPRHLRPARVAADREVGLMQQALAASGRLDRATAATREAELAELLVRLHAALLWSGLGHAEGRIRG